MKIWIKYLIAIILGLAFGWIVPVGGQVLDSLASAAINIARIILVPLLVFSIPVAVHELHGDRKLGRSLLRTGLYSAAAIILLTLIGSGAAILFSGSRIPLGSESGNIDFLPGFGDLLLKAFPQNIVGAIGQADYLLPILLLGLIMGLAFSSERSTVKPVLQLADSMSRLLWQINSFIVEIFPLPLIALSAARIVSLRSLADYSPYARLFSLLGLQILVILVVLLPLVLFLAGRRRNPLPIMYAMLAPALAAALTAHAYAPAGILAKHLKESLGVRRRIGSLSLPLAMILGRPGTALVSASSFIIILNSYSSLGLGPNAFLWILGMVPLSVLLASAAPALGPVAGVAYLSHAYGKGFESGYLLILPIALPLQAIAVFLDTMILGGIVYLTASAEKETVYKELRHFI